MNRLNITPLPLWLTPQLPAINANAVSYEQLIREFLYRLRVVEKYCNSVQEFSEEVAKILNDMNVHINSIVLEKLTEWYEDGTLIEMLAVVSADYFEIYNQKLEDLKQNSVLKLENQTISLLLRGDDNDSD